MKVWTKSDQSFSPFRATIFKISNHRRLIPRARRVETQELAESELMFSELWKREPGLIVSRWLGRQNTVTIESKKNTSDVFFCQNQKRVVNLWVLRVGSPYSPPPERSNPDLGLFDIRLCYRAIRCSTRVVPVIYNANGVPRVAIDQIRTLWIDGKRPVEHR